MKRRLTALLALGSVAAMAVVIGAQVRADREADQAPGKSGVAPGSCCDSHKAKAGTAAEEEMPACCAGASHDEETSWGQTCPAGGCSAAARFGGGCPAMTGGNAGACSGADASCCPGGAGCGDRKAAGGSSGQPGEQKKATEEELAGYGERET